MIEIRTAVVTGAGFEVGHKTSDLVYFLASEQSSHIIGAEMYIDGAESLL